jgi:chloride channel protein, CIC family
VVAMGAVFTSAARAPLTSLASVVEMTGDFTLTLPVMLAVAIASTISRALSYGTIYTTKLLRRGTDIDRATPWRALQDIKVADAMQPFRPPLLVKRGADGASQAAGAAPAPLPGPVTAERDPQAIFATESLAQTLRQLEVYGRDGLPVLSDDGQQIAGWVTNASVLAAVAREVDTAQEQTIDAQAADRDTPGPSAAKPPSPLPGYRIVEITIADGSPAAGTRLGDITWPPGYFPVSVLHDRSLRAPDPQAVLGAGDRVNLLTPQAS